MAYPGQSFGLRNPPYQWYANFSKTYVITFFACFNRPQES